MNPGARGPGSPSRPSPESGALGYGPWVGTAHLSSTDTASGPPESTPCACPTAQYTHVCQCSVILNHPALALCIRCIPETVNDTCQLGDLECSGSACSPWEPREIVRLISQFSREAVLPQPSLWVRTLSFVVAYGLSQASAKFLGQRELGMPASAQFVPGEKKGQLCLPHAT